VTAIARDHTPAPQKDELARRSAAGPELEAPLPMAGAASLHSVLMRTLDAGSTQRMIGGLQGRIGNAGVADVIAGGPARSRRAFQEGALPGGTAPAQRQGGEPAFGQDEPLELEGPTSIPTSKTDHNVAKATFTVSGSLQQAADSLAARNEAGSVATGFSSINFTTKGESVVAAVLEVTSTVTLPVWSDRGSAPPEEQKEWDRFAAAIAAHEAQHLALDKREFANAHAKCLGKTETKADEALDAVQTKADTVNQEYDTQTDHGKNAGTKINPSAGKTIKVPPS
jgi:hypothetical protein